ncbi:MAG: winged helix-turn-helix transcriptional regulator [Clostridiales bacterium]|jgi:predicted transcriptional regulator/anti-sigma regulatory factor (Ser/Thr protein kinase)|nr:winged helix-turn-helix transcriptional regulator [Clostridiales bacterium]
MPLSPERREEIVSAMINTIGEHNNNAALAPSELAKRFGVSGQSIARIIKKLEESGRVLTVAEGKKKSFSLPTVTKTLEYKTEGLDEESVFASDVKAFISGVPECPYKNFSYAFLEMLNNAIEHSNGSKIYIYLIKNEYRLAFLLMDDGIGIFKKISDALGLREKRHALLELSKGKFTTDPGSHSGEGIFFSSKCGDLFTLMSDGISFLSAPDYNMLIDDVVTPLMRKKFRTGTEIFFEIKMSHTQTLAELFQEYTDAPESYGFTKTKIPIRLLEYGDSMPLFLSRSEAVQRMITHVTR